MTVTRPSTRLIATRRRICSRYLPAPGKSPAAIARRRRCHGATKSERQAKIMTTALYHRRLDPAGVFRSRFHQPLPYRLGIGAGDMEVECRRVVDRMEERADMAEQTLRAGAGGKRARMKVDRAALGEEIMASSPRDAQRGAAVPKIGDPGRDHGKGGAQQAVEIAIGLLRLDDKPTLRADPEDRRLSIARRAVRSRGRRDAQRAGKSVAHRPALLGTRGDLHRGERTAFGDGDPGAVRASCAEITGPVDSGEGRDALKHGGALRRDRRRPDR